MNVAEFTTSARSGIEDADFAAERDLLRRRFFSDGTACSLSKYAASIGSGDRVSAKREGFTG